MPEAFIGKVVRCQPCGNTIHVQSEPPRRPVDMPMVPRSREEVPQSEIDAGWGYIFPPSD
ncbi:MAG: hypothetical protein GC159_00980 [Phycisphaera sp.]|nr:hypothetical protein [Phycisphaera sp.]